MAILTLFHCETNSPKPQKTHFKSQGWPLYEVSSITAWCTFQLNQYILYCCCTSQENNKLVNVLSNLQVECPMCRMAIAYNLEELKALASNDVNEEKVC